MTSIECPQVQECCSRAWTPKEVAHFVDRYYNDCPCLPENDAWSTDAPSITMSKFRQLVDKSVKFTALEVMSLG